MYKNLILIILVLTCVRKKPEEERLQLKLIDYREYLAAYRKNPDLRKLRRDYNMLNILLLDSTNASSFFKISPSLKDDYISASKTILSQKFTLGFLTKAQTLRELIVSNVFGDRMFNCINPFYPSVDGDYKIISPVYIKDNTAVVTVTNEAESIFDVYYVTLDLENAIVHLTLVYAAMDG